MKLTERGEFQIIEHLKKQGRTIPGLICGIGDDCSVARIDESQELLTTTDLLTEGIHFNLDWSDLHHLGRKAVSVNVSDLAAMGARPLFLFLSLAIPDDINVDQLDQFLSGFLQASDAYGAVLAGGDTCRSRSGLTISVSAQGVAMKATSIMRQGAKAGNDLFVTGTLGDSALALRQLMAGKTPTPFLLERHIDPTARIETGQALVEDSIPTAMIDVSDGLLADLEHVLRASGVGAVVDLETIPLSRAFRQEMDSNPDLMGLALSGGEDYELLFTAPAEAQKAISAIAEKTGVPISRIGRIDENREELNLLGPSGAVELPPQRGYKHFPDTP
jgi:thiamine-monophosphate kinase